MEEGKDRLTHSLPPFSWLHDVIQEFDSDTKLMQNLGKGLGWSLVKCWNTDIMSPRDPYSEEWTLKEKP